MAVSLGPGCRADHGGYNVHSTARSQKRRMKAPGAGTWLSFRTPGPHHSPRQRRTHHITPLAAMASGSKDPGAPGTVWWLICCEQGQIAPPDPISPRLHASKSAWVRSTLTQPENLHCWENKVTVKWLCPGHLSQPQQQTQAGPQQDYSVCLMFFWRFLPILVIGKLFI